MVLINQKFSQLNRLISHWESAQYLDSTSNWGDVTKGVELIDTVEVARTRYSVFRLRRGILDRSNIGMLFTSKSPGENSSYNRSFGADLNLSLLNATLSAKGFIAKTWTPGLEGRDFAGLADLEYRKRLLQIQLSFLDVKENFILSAFCFSS